LIVSQGKLSMCAAGNPGMATAGMGDVLAGVIGGLAAQFGGSHQTVCQAVVAHAVAGDMAARHGQRGLMATDLLQPLRELVNR
jgi:NAD(P)H-hydrate epimerase